MKLEFSYLELAIRSYHFGSDVHSIIPEGGYLKAFVHDKINY